MAEYSPVRNPRRPGFAPRLLPTLLTLAAVALFAAAGAWQLGRAAQKRALAADFAGGGPALEWRQLPADAPRYQRVTLRGHYDPDRQFLLDTMAHESVAGLQVLTPLVLDDGSAVLVNRGWLPWGPSRAVLPDVAVGGEKRTVVGRIDELPKPGIWLEAPAATGWPRLVQYPRMEELREALGRELPRWQVLLDPAVPDGFVRAWTVPGTPADRHLGYAVQWFAFAAVAIAIWLVLGFRRSGESA
jgi:surfeit locus 1 family protein